VFFTINKLTVSHDGFRLFHSFVITFDISFEAIHGDLENGLANWILSDSNDFVVISGSKLHQGFVSFDSHVEVVAIRAKGAFDGRKHA
jgi:hypothetical protein